MNDQETITYVEGEQAIIKSPENSESAKRIRPFDIRSLGLLSLTEFEIGASTQQLLDFLKNRKVTSLANVEESSGIYKITWVSNSGTPGELKRTHWIDSTRGFTPIRLEVRAPAAEGKSWDDSRIVVSADISWEQINAAWLPTKCRMDDAFGIRELSMTFNWTSVNSNIDSDRFTAASIKVPDGTYTVDTRLGTPIVESISGAPDSPNSGTRPAWRWRHVIMIFNVIVVVLIALLLVVRHYRQKTLES